MFSVCDEQRMLGLAALLSRERGFGESALIIMKSSSSELLKMHDGIAVWYMPEIKPVSQSSKPFQRPMKCPP